MTPTIEQINAWERELGYDVDDYGSDAFLAAFAALAYAAGAAAEREACAKVCEFNFSSGALDCAAAIRARKP